MPLLITPGFLNSNLFRCSFKKTIKMQKTKKINISIGAQFIILPGHSEKKIIFGNPLLHQLNYRLTSGHEYLTIEGQEINIFEANIHFSAHQVNIYLHNVHQFNLLFNCI